MILSGGADSRKRIQYAYHRAAARAATPVEVKILSELAAKERTGYTKAAAERFLAVGEFKYDRKIDPVELAAWTSVASTILNLDEVITKE